ncbi:hypothetical protein [Nakamurella endophytica]|uniref:Uncharacterized protein n=1 Tax=Nakamurella endophytica TaxID=1748367 RepID=A0A917SZZ7_9ACTN|nr:hypothetical protein [Nakamurella endophytica]GGM04355.1 hypothetical protein GCM10011594_25710 [Nakamurella endophytica]
MSLLTDLRSVSESAVDQLAARFPDLPRPLLAAIGAGDIAVRRLAELRESLRETLPSAPEAGDVRAAAADLPGRAQRAAADLPARAQRIAADVAQSVEQFAAEAPGKAQELIGELPAKLAEFGQAVSGTSVRSTVEAYTHLAGIIYGNLAKRGDRAWHDVRAGDLRPGTVVDGGSAAPAASGTVPAADAEPPVAESAPPVPAADDVAEAIAAATTTPTTSAQSARASKARARVAAAEVEATARARATRAGRTATGAAATRRATSPATTPRRTPKPRGTTAG